MDLSVKVVVQLYDQIFVQFYIILNFDICI